MNLTFPTLYKKTSAGKIQEWVISVECSDVIVTYGLQGGKKKVDRKTIKSGKNVGKKNETSPHEQAALESESKWKKQLDSGYVEDISKVDDIVYLPMLAHPYSKIKNGKECGRKKYMKMPCIGQRKYNGVRCFAFIGKDGDVVLQSRKGKRFPHMEHLFGQVETFCKDTNLIIDCELYSDDMTFQRLVGLVKRETLKDGDDVDMSTIKLRTYDCVIKDNLSASFEERYDVVSNRIKETYKFSVIEEYITLVENFEINSEEDIKPLHDQFVKEGYEGLILRGKTGAYKLNKRSNDLQKYKEFQDAEFEVVGYESGVGRAEGTVIFQCKTESGNVFNVRPRGTDDQRRAWFENGDDYIGEELTVRYFELTEDAKVPLFPVGICFRGKVGGEII